jgi:hypothetical protein
VQLGCFDLGQKYALYRRSLGGRFLLVESARHHILEVVALYNRRGPALAASAGRLTRRVRSTITAPRLRARAALPASLGLPHCIDGRGRLTWSDAGLAGRMQSSAPVRQLLRGPLLGHRLLSGDSDGVRRDLWGRYRFLARRTFSRRLVGCLRCVNFGGMRLYCRRFGG